MLTKLRTSLSVLLDPEAHLERERFRVLIGQYQQWLGQYPGVSEALAHLRAEVEGTERYNMHDVRDVVKHALFMGNLPGLQPLALLNPRDADWELVRAAAGAMGVRLQQCRRGGRFGWNSHEQELNDQFRQAAMKNLESGQFVDALNYIAMLMLRRVHGLK